MKRLQLKVQKRKVLGKKVKQLRKSGLIPANVYGKKIKSLAVQVARGEFAPVYRKAKETTIVELLIDKIKDPRHVLIRHLQTDPVSEKAIHVDFQQVDLKENIEANIPIRIKGESPAVKDKQAVLLHELNELLVEAQADKLPEAIHVNIGKLTKVGQDIRVKDLKAPLGVEIKTDPEHVIVRLDELVSKEAEELEAKEEAVEEAKAELSSAKATSDMAKSKAEEEKGEVEETKPEEKNKKEQLKKDK